MKEKAKKRSKRTDLLEFMSFKEKKKGIKVKPISVMMVNDDFILAIYRGKKGKNDIIIRYRQKLKGGRWSQIRTPKHIHWTVDMLMKISHQKDLAEKFIGELVEIWKKVKPLTKVEELNLDELLRYDSWTIYKFKELSKYGEYNIKFLLLLAKLLMIQEKTNYPQGKLFQTLLEKLKKGEDVFSILQTASLRKIK